jgi:uncharacterized protein (DUF2141 family)
LGKLTTVTFLATLTCATPSVVEAATVVVDVVGVAPGHGRVFASLCAGGLDREFCPRGQVTLAQSGSIRFVFAAVPAGSYAVAVFQDVNGNGSLDRTPLGLPLEPFGFSNQVGRLRRPTFAAAAFEVAGESVAVEVRLASLPAGERR